MAVQNSSGLLARADAHARMRVVIMQPPSFSRRTIKTFFPVNSWTTSDMCMPTMLLALSYRLPYLYLEWSCYSNLKKMKLGLLALA